jgi:CheY-like chemotaxis protein
MLNPNDTKANEWNPDSVSDSQSGSHSSFSRSRHLPFDAVVLDYRMPKKDGLEVAKEILKMYPEQRIIFASAYIKESLEGAIKSPSVL